jgi:hypothetical protein
MNAGELLRQQIVNGYEKSVTRLETELFGGTIAKIHPTLKLEKCS